MEEPEPEHRARSTGARSYLASEFSSGGLPIDPDVDPDEDARHHTGSGPFDQPRQAGWPRLRPVVLAAVFIGGCVGGLARYQLTKAWPTPAHGFPWATFVINNSGAFVLALLLVLVIEVLPPTTYVRPLLGTGFCGAWTTFSSIVVTADQLIAHGHPRLGATYVLTSMVAGLGSAALGLVLVRSIGAWRHKDRDTGNDTGEAS